MWQTKITAFLFALLILSAYSCRRPHIEEIKSPFHKKTIHINVNGEQHYKGCIRRYLQFESLESSILYKGKVISTTTMGGFIAFDLGKMERDTTLERLLNTDFFTGIALFRDTLFTQKFGAIYYWNTEHWKAYSSKLPVNCFELIYEDSASAFFCTDGGEFGSMIYRYDFGSATTNAYYSYGVNSMFRVDSGYFIGHHLRHMSDFSYMEVVLDTRNWVKVSRALSLAGSTMFDRNKAFDSIRAASKIAEQNSSPYHCTISRFQKHLPRSEGRRRPDSSCEHIMISGSFIYGKTIYHFTEGEYGDSQVYLTTIRHDTLYTVDSLPLTRMNQVRYFGNTALISHANGFTILRGDTLLRVRYHTQLPSYHGPKLEFAYYPTDSLEKPLKIITPTYNMDEDYRPIKGKPYNEFHISIDKIRSIHIWSNSWPDNTVESIWQVGNIHRRIPIPEVPYTAFILHDRPFLWYWSLGLMEITDFERFGNGFTVPVTRPLMPSSH
jgi:hypothetical protein